MGTMDSKTIAIVLAPYFGQKCLCKTPKLETKQLIDVDPDLLSTPGRKYFTDVQIILKPLAEITNEDAIEVAKMLYPEYGNKEYNWTERIGKFYIEHVFLNRKSAVMKTQIYQFLQSKGYDLPHYLLGDKTLKEAGLAIYE